MSADEANSAKLPAQSIITLKKSVLPESISPTHEIEGTGISYSLADDYILVAIERTALFKIIHQTEVLYDASRYPDSTERRIGLTFLHLILQFLITGTVNPHTQFLFHGSAVSLPDDAGALILIGNKGAGKSTIAAALSLSGCKLLCDDIIPIVTGPAVMPGITRAKLLPDAYEKLFAGSEPAGHLFDGISKYYTDLSQAENTHPQPQSYTLAAIIYLEQEAVESVKISPLHGALKFQKMIKQVIRIDGLDTAAELFTTVIENCRDIPLYQITFPENESPWLVSRLILDQID
jgi:hypothetical protein